MNNSQSFYSTLKIKKATDAELAGIWGAAFKGAVKASKSGFNQLEKAHNNAKRRALNDTFEQAWCALKAPHITAEHKFHPKKKWRFDYAHLATMVAIELEGITHAGGRHQRFKGYTADVEKYNAAALLGWTVMRLTKQQINVTNLSNIIDLIAFKSAGGLTHA